MSAPTTRIWIGGMGALLACVGCGFKGPLYLPERNATVITHASPAPQGAAPPSQGQPQTPSTKNKNKTPAPQSSPPPSPPLN